MTFYVPEHTLTNTNQSRHLLNQQKFPIVGRPDGPFAAPMANGKNNSPPATGNGAKQYTIVNTEHATAALDKQQLALANGYPASGGGVAAGGKHHHSILHHLTNSRSSKSKKNVNFCRAWLNKFPSRSKRIDVISRIFFPKMFALFNLVYWTTYLFREDDVSRT